MPTIYVLPHSIYCPNGAKIQSITGSTICETLLENDIQIEHACEMSAACTTCHVILKSGYQSLKPPEEVEEDLLDRAWGLEPNSRLSCQAFVEKDDLTIEIPKYSLNHAREN